MDWNIIFFELALVALLLPVGISLYVVLSSIKDILDRFTDSLDKVGEKLDKNIEADTEIKHRIEMLESRIKG